MNQDQFFEMLFTKASMEPITKTCKDESTAHKVRFSLYSWRTKMRRKNKLLPEWDDITIQLQPVPDSKKFLIMLSPGGSLKESLQEVFADEIEEFKKEPDALDLIKEAESNKRQARAPLDTSLTITEIAELAEKKSDPVAHLYSIDEEADKEG